MKPISLERLAVPLAMGCLLILSGIASGNEVTFRLLKEEIYDKPLKTQIKQDFLASAVPTRAELEAATLARYRMATARKNFRYHNPATNIYIYVYGTEEQALVGQGLWIAMLAVDPVEPKPRVLINDDRLAALSQQPEVRHGLAESRRKEVFREIVAAEDRANREAMARVSDSQVTRQVELERELADKYKAKVASTHGLTDDQLVKIGLEGIKKGWPMP